MYYKGVKLSSNYKLKKYMMKFKALKLILLSILFFTNCRTDFQPETKDVLNFQSDLDSQVNENMPGILVSVISKDKKINWTGASGFSDKENKTLLTANQVFRIASVTKTFVAATILRLWEDGKLKLDDPISKFISEEHAAILKKGEYNPLEITIFHLLTHSSGLSEHTQSEKYKIDYMLTNHIWSRTEQLNDLIKYTKPIGKVGEQFSYSDSGYGLLGEIIENITHQSLGDAIVEQLNLKKLGLCNIYFEDFKGDFSNKRIHQYLEDKDTYYINPSLDYYGGGGLLSNTHDLSLFYLYLFENKIFHNKATLTKMLSPVSFPSKQSLDYRMGIWKTEIAGMPAYTHTGFWGTQVIYIPQIKTSIAVNYSQKWNKKGYAPVIPTIVEKLLKK